jgi:hypothetical protein
MSGRAQVAKQHEDTRMVVSSIRAKQLATSGNPVAYQAPNPRQERVADDCKLDFANMVLRIVERP